MTAVSESRAGVYIGGSTEGSNQRLAGEGGAEQRCNTKHDRNKEVVSWGRYFSHITKPLKHMEVTGLTPNP